MNSVAPEPPLELVQEKKVVGELTRIERQMIISRLLWILKERDGIMCLKKEIAVLLMEEFHVSCWTLKRIWNCAQENSDNFEGLDPQFLTSHHWNEQIAVIDKRVFGGKKEKKHNPMLSGHESFINLSITDKRQ